VNIDCSLLPNPYEINIWNTRQQLTKDMVTECLKRGLVKRYPIFDYEDHEDELLHAQRVCHFIMDKWSDPVDADVQFTPEGEPYIWNIDGCHRVAAALYMEWETITCLYNEVVEQYLRERDL